MQHSNNAKLDLSSTLSALQKMLQVMKVLLELRKQKSKASIGALICKKLSEFQQIYLALDAEDKRKVHELLSENNKPLLLALEKKGSKISKPLDLAEHITDDLPEKFEKIIAENTAVSTITATPAQSFEEVEFEDAMCTMHVKSDIPADDQLSAAIARAAHQMDPQLYGLFSVNDASAHISDPIDAVIQALEILRKTQLNKEKITNGMQKPPGFDLAYRETLLKQMNILSKCKDDLKKIVLDDEGNKILSEIITRLENHKHAYVPSILIAAGAISVIINENLITNLREFHIKEFDSCSSFFGVSEHLNSRK